jgi:cytochrome c peroxidase
MTASLLEDRLRAAPEYRRLFRLAFEDAPPPFTFDQSDDATSPTSAQVAAALSTFIRSLRSGDAPIDRYQAGDSSALTPLQKEGLALFIGRARCSGCHLGPNFTDERFHNTGVAVRSGDPGRYAITGNRHHEGAFRTPALRDVSLTAPYMHDGSIATLEEVIDFYDKGGVENANLNSQIRRIGLDPSEKAALVAFLSALTGSVASGR